MTLATKGGIFRINALLRHRSWQEMLSPPLYQTSPSLLLLIYNRPCRLTPLNMGWCILLLFRVSLLAWMVAAKEVDQGVVVRTVRIRLHPRVKTNGSIRIRACYRLMPALARKANRNTSQAIQNQNQDQDLGAEARVLQRRGVAVAVRVPCRCGINM